MARQGKLRNKVVSSGRLTGCGRGQATKKTVAGRHVAPLEPAYSLYSTDSEDQVTTVNKGLDRCAALLSGILQAEKTESKSKSHLSKAASCKLKSKVTHGKMEAERKRLGKKPISGTHITKKPAPVQKTILSSQSYPGLRGQPIDVNIPAGPEVKPTTPTPVIEHIKSHPNPPVSGGSSSLPSTGFAGPQTLFNCRLASSTPALSPQRPTSAHSQVSHRGADGEIQCFTQQWNAANGGQIGQHGASSTAAPPTQYTFSLSRVPTVQQHAVGCAMSSLQQASVSLDAKEELRVPSPHLSAPHLGSVGQSTSSSSHHGSQTVATHISSQVPIISPPQAHPQPVLVSANAQEQQFPPVESSEESGGCSSEEDELAGVDITPVRDTSCQTSMNKHTVMFNHKGKSSSPKKTAQKVMTVRYLLGELKTLVANQDSEAVRLISEVEQSISLLPAMVGSTNVQAELALALQPLRSENVQLRRRLRILNQQLLERERAERQARPVDYDLELASIQSLNLTLQTQLNDSHQELENLQQENQRLIQALQDKENELQQSKEQCELETSRIRMDVSEALAEMRNCQHKLEDSEREKIALTRSLQQKEAEITRLEEIIRTLQKSTTTDITCHLGQTDLPKPPSKLTKSVLDLYENQQKETLAADRISDSVKTYLQTLEATGHNSPRHQAHSRLHSLPPGSPEQWRSIEQSCGLQTKACSQKDVDIHRLELPSSAGSGSGTQEGGESDSKTTFVPLRETVRVQPAAQVIQKVSPVKPNEGNQVDGENRYPGLKYLGLAFDKLGISTGLPTPQVLKALDDNRGKDFLSHADGVGSQLKRTNETTAILSEQSPNARRCLQMDESTYTGRLSVFENTLSSCDIKSLASDWSVNSWSTFNTRDEQNFRNGLAALDASIASLQKTLKADLKK